MNKRLEQAVLIAIAVVSGVAGFGVKPELAGLILAGLNIALALCVPLR